MFVLFWQLVRFLVWKEEGIKYVVHKIQDYDLIFFTTALLTNLYTRDCILLTRGKHLYDSITSLRRNPMGIFVFCFVFCLLVFFVVCLICLFYYSYKFVHFCVNIPNCHAKLLIPVSQKYPENPGRQSHVHVSNEIVPLLLHFTPGQSIKITKTTYKSNYQCQSVHRTTLHMPQDVNAILLTSI